MNANPSPHSVPAWAHGQRRARNFASTVLLGALLGGCSFAPKAPLGVVDLPMPASAISASEPIALQLVVMEPQATALVDSPRIVVRDASGQLAQLAGVALPDRAPRWLQSQLLQGLSAHPFAAVAAPGAGLTPDLHLLLRLERFELDYRGVGQADIALHALLLDARSGRAIASARFAQQAAVEGSGSSAGAEALQGASFAALSALAEWAAQQARGSVEKSD